MAAGWKEFDCVEEVAFFAFWGLQGGKLKAGGHLVLPPAFNSWGVDIVKAHKEHFKADAVITHWDIWVVDEKFVEQAYPWCVTGDAMLSLADGSELPIKGVVDKRLEAQLADGGEIIDWHVVGVRKVIVITTESGKQVTLTPDTRVQIATDAGPKWVAGSLTNPGDMVYCGGNRLERIISVQASQIARPVYDLTTTTGSFLANGLLVHNCPYFPVDQYPVPPRVIARARECYQPIVYSKFALEAMREIGIECAYVPHGCFSYDTRVLVTKDREEHLGDIVLGKVNINKIIGVNQEGQPCQAEILDRQMLPLLDSHALDITTESGRRLRVTRDNKILTDKGWVPAGDLTKGALIGIMDIPEYQYLQEVSNGRRTTLDKAGNRGAQGEVCNCAQGRNTACPTQASVMARHSKQGSETRLTSVAQGDISRNRASQARLVANRVSLFGGRNRCRRLYLAKESDTKAQYDVLHANDGDLQSERQVNGVARCTHTVDNCVTGGRDGLVKNPDFSPNGKRTRSAKSLTATSALLAGEEKTGRISNRVLPISGGADRALGVWGEGARILSGGVAAESRFLSLDWVSIPHITFEQIVNIEPVELDMVYDLTTSTGNFIANGVVVHNCDLTVFKPLDKMECRRRLGFPEDAFIIGMVAANKGYPSRKAIPESLLAFEEFRRRHDDAILYLHMYPKTDNAGVDVHAIIRSLNLPPGSVKLVDEYHYLVGLPDQYLADAYNSFNVLNAESMGEGFGLPICFLPGQWVYLKGGIQPIEDVLAGDSVLTHTGKYQKVLAGGMSRRVEDEEIVALSVPGYNQPLRMTAEHPMRVLRPPYRRFISVRRALARGLQPQWIQAADIQEGDFLVVPMPPIQDAISVVDLRPFTDVPSVDGRLVSKYSNTGELGVTYQDVADEAGVSFTTVTRVLGGYEGYRVGKGISAETQAKVDAAIATLGWTGEKRGIPADMPLDYDTGLLFGYYIAEGNLGTNYQVELASHIREDEYRQVIREILGRWGLNVRIRQHHGLAARLLTCNKALAQVLGRLCGSGAHNKHIPMRYALANKAFARGLITGMWWGDGCTVKRGFSYSTVSVRLAHEYRRLLLEFGLLASVRSSDRTASGRGIEYCVVITGRQSDDFADLIGEERPHTGEREGQSFILYPDHQCAYVPIKEVGRERYSGEVFNLEVEEDNSYCVMGLAAHNCEAQACGTRVVTTNCSAMPENTFDGIVTEPAQRFWTQLDSWAVMPSVWNMLEAWERIYAGELGDPFSHSQKAIEGARKFDWPLVLENHWKPFLQSLEARLKGVGSAFYSSECGNKHRWAKTGLYDHGVLCVPCLRKWCPAELAALPGGRQVVRDTGFAMEKDGIALDINDDPDGGVAKIAYREIESSYGISDIPFEPGDVVLDLGAHVGVISIYIASHHPGVTVYAFEPVAANFERLRRNVEVNGVEDNVVAVNVAVTGDGRDLALVGNLAENSGGATAFGPPAGRAGPTAKGLSDRGKARVESMTLREIFDEYVPGRCKLLKLDVEGAEYEILQADPELLGRVDYLAAEFHVNNVLEAQGCDPEALKELCAAHIEPGHLHISTSRIADRVDAEGE